MLSASFHLITILPGEIREIGDLQIQNLFDCLGADSSYTFTITYRPVVTLGAPTASELEKTARLRTRLQSINERIYNLGLYQGSASTNYTSTELYSYDRYYKEVLSKITDITLTSNTVTITR